MYTEYELRPLPLSVKSIRTKAEQFLNKNQLRLEHTDYFAGVFRIDGDEILACGGVKNNLIKCIAVGDELRDTGMGSRLISHLVSVVMQRSNNVKVFTKPENVQIFKSLGFSLIASAEHAVLMENNTKPLENYCRYLASHKKDGFNGVIVMNCNPFTLGHRYLIEPASAKTDNLYIIAVKENISMFSYADRLQMIKNATADLPNVTVLEGSEYSVSEFTFPTYFLKDLNYAADTHITLDLDLFCKYLAPHLNAKIRFVGSEPFDYDKLTCRYNELMSQILPLHGIDVQQIPRLEKDGKAVSASVLRKHLNEGRLSLAINTAYPTTVPFLLGYTAALCLQKELDTTPKPGLIDKNDNGAHSDMDYHLMTTSINALLPYFNRLASIGYCRSMPDAQQVKALGLQAEEAMFNATHGINTHKGALFSMGLAVVCAANILYNCQTINAQQLQQQIINLSAGFTQPEGTHGSKALNENPLKGALACANEGYKELFSSWLPFYRANINDEYAMHKLVLLIMSEIDDTNIYYRKDKATVEYVKNISKTILNDFSTEKLNALNAEFIRMNISPGGAADMLALTLFISSAVN